MKRTRLFQITVLLLVIVAAVQVGYWIYDQHQRGAERTAALTRLYDQQSAAARTMIAAGVRLAERTRRVPRPVRECHPGDAGPGASRPNC